MSNLFEKLLQTVSVKETQFGSLRSAAEAGGMLEGPAGSQGLQRGSAAPGYRTSPQGETRSVLQARCAPLALPKAGYSPIWEHWQFLEENCIEVHLSCKFRESLGKRVSPSRPRGLALADPLGAAGVEFTLRTTTATTLGSSGNSLRSYLLLR